MAAQLRASAQNTATRLQIYSITNLFLVGNESFTQFSPRGPEVALNPQEACDLPWLSLSFVVQKASALFKSETIHHF
jgi:hypothetical protein